MKRAAMVALACGVVAVPAHAGLRASVPIGTITATGLAGSITLSGTNGSIWATDLTGTISLTTQSGSINLTRVRGQVSVATQNGTVTTTATQLEGHSSVRAESGTINFHGTLSPQGRYLFQRGDGAWCRNAPAADLPRGLSEGADRSQFTVGVGAAEQDLMSVSKVKQPALEQSRLQVIGQS